MEIRDTNRVFISNISNLKQKFRVSIDGQEFYFITDDGRYLSTNGDVSNTRQSFIITDMDGNRVNTIIEGYDYMLMYNGCVVLFGENRDTANLRFKIAEEEEEEELPPPKPTPPPPTRPNNPDRGRIVINKTTNVNSNFSTVMLIIFVSIIFFIVIIVLMFLVFFIRKSD